MNMTAFIDVAIGLSLVFLGVSLFVTIINEYISQLLNLRGAELCKALQKLLHDQQIKELLGNSPILKPFFDSQYKKAPSYIDTKLAAKMLVGGLLKDKGDNDLIVHLESSIAKLSDSKLKTQLETLIRTADDNIDAITKEVSQWMDRSLTVLGEIYKRKLRIISLVIGLVIAGALNIDAVTLTAELYKNKELRDATVAMAVELTEDSSPELIKQCTSADVQSDDITKNCNVLFELMDTVKNNNDNLSQLPIGWETNIVATFKALGWGGTLITILGWILTGLAVSLGAPFWFDLLNKLVNVRHGMKQLESEITNSNVKATKAG